MKNRSYLCKRNTFRALRFRKFSHYIITFCQFLWFYISSFGYSREGFKGQSVYVLLAVEHWGVFLFMTMRSKSKGPLSNICSILQFSMRLFRNLSVSGSDAICDFEFSPIFLQCLFPSPRTVEQTLHSLRDFGWAPVHAFIRRRPRGGESAGSIADMFNKTIGQCKGFLSEWVNKIRVHSSSSVDSEIYRCKGFFVNYKRCCCHHCLMVVKQ